MKDQNIILPGLEYDNMNWRKIYEVGEYAKVINIVSLIVNKLVQFY